MAKQPVKNSQKQVNKPVAANQIAPSQFVFGRRNYMVMIIGLTVMATGFLLMIGGSQSPDQFDTSIVYSFRRSTLSTIFVTIGLLVVLYSIFLKHPGNQQDKAEVYIKAR